jgi:hypothetical protein
LKIFFKAASGISGAASLDTVSQAPAWETNKNCSGMDLILFIKLLLGKQKLSQEIL